MICGCLCVLCKFHFLFLLIRLKSKSGKCRFPPKSFIILTTDRQTTYPTATKICQASEASNLIKTIKCQIGKKLIVNLARFDAFKFLEKNKQ